MLRTKINLPEDVFKEINIISRNEKKPLAHVIRELLIAGLDGRRTETIGSALTKLANLSVRGGPPDLSTSIDVYLYEK